MQGERAAHLEGMELRTRMTGVEDHEEFEMQLSDGNSRAMHGEADGKNEGGRMENGPDIRRRRRRGGMATLRGCKDALAPV